MAYSAVGFLRENLIELLTHRLDLIGKVQNDLQQVKYQLDLLQGFLDDAFKNKKDAEYLKELDRKVKDAVYEVEDLIDSYITGVLTRKSTSILRSSSHHRSTQLKFLEYKLKPLIDEIKMDLRNLTIADEPGGGEEGKTSEYRMRSKAPREDMVVGLEFELETLVSRVSEESDGVDVIPITGMGGIGKTTMAWRMYRDPRIMFEFPTRIWVTISQDLNIRHVCLTILKHFSSQDMSSLNDNELILMVNEYLQTGKFLIVFDDVWGPEAWDKIKRLLAMNNKYGKVVVTTRYLDDGANFGGENHKLRFLTLKESWEMLQLQVFHSSACPSELVEVGTVIATACNGLPLLIVIIGGLLADSFASSSSLTIVRKEWEIISKNVRDHMFKEGGQQANTLISLSVISLPPGLKDCFLYLGVFPEDAEIPLWKLTQLWIAEGFIRQDENQTLEETAKQVLNDLINRNLLVVDRTNAHGEVKTCRIHNIIREFCRREAFAVGLFQELTWSQQDELRPPSLSLYNSRRLCLDSNFHEFLREKPEFRKARSLLCLSKEPYDLMPNDVSSLLATFSVLRVWDTNNLRFAVFPKKLTELVHLRYITLFIGSLDYLPAAISRLLSLRTLVVDTCSRTLTIKADIWKLMQLRHLKTQASILLMEGNGDGGAKLQTLTRLSTKSFSPTLLKKAKNLKMLGICGSLSGSMCFSELQSLDTLKLEHDVFPRDHREMPMDRLPKPNDFPPKIRCLVLSQTYLEWKHMSVLAQIRSLEFLKLKNNAFTGSNWEVDSGSFENLVTFSINHADLRNWIAPSNSFNKLKTLILKNCEQLVQIPQNLEETLELLSLERVTRYAVSCAKEMVQTRAASGKGEFQLRIAPEYTI